MTLTLNQPNYLPSVSNQGFQALSFGSCASSAVVVFKGGLEQQQLLPRKPLQDQFTTTLRFGNGQEDITSIHAPGTPSGPPIKSPPKKWILAALFALLGVGAIWGLQQERAGKKPPPDETPATGFNYTSPCTHDAQKDITADGVEEIQHAETGEVVDVKYAFQYKDGQLSDLVLVIPSADGIPVTLRLQCSCDELADRLTIKTPEQLYKEIETYPELAKSLKEEGIDPAKTPEKVINRLKDDVVGRSAQELLEMLFKITAKDILHTPAAALDAEKILGKVEFVLSGITGLNLDVSVDIPSDSGKQQAPKTEKELL